MENQVPKKPRVAKIVVDRNLCIGNASCVAVLPSVFEIDPENKAVFRKKTKPPTSETARDELEDETASDDMLLLAAQSCPTKAIIVYDEDGNQLYP